MDYVIWPWFVPGVRAEYTLGHAAGASNFGLLRVVPGIAMLVRPDVRVILSGDLETAYGAPVAGSWGCSWRRDRALDGREAERFPGRDDHRKRCRGLLRRQR